MLASAARFVVGALILPVAAIAGIGLAAFVAHQQTSPWTPPDVKEELVPVLTSVKIPSISGTAAVKGTVLAEGGRPIAGATVRVSAGFVMLETLTQNTGVFTASKLPDAPVTFVVLAPGYRPAFAGPLLPPKSEITIHLEAAESPDPQDSVVNNGVGSLTVLVSAEGGAPLPALTIAAVPETRDGRDFALIPRVAEIDPASSPIARLTRLPVGPYRILVLPRGAPVDSKVAFHTARLDVLAGAEPKTVSYAIRWGEVSGRVAFHGEPLRRAFVRAIRRTETQQGQGPLESREIELARASTDSDGRFALGELPVGESTIEILTTGFSPWSRIVTVGAEPKPLEIELTKEK